MAGNTVCATYARDLQNAIHDHGVGQHVFKLMLYTSLSGLNADLAWTTSTNEVVGAGYVANGATLTNVAPSLSGKTGFSQWEDITFSGADFSTVGGVIYNSTPKGVVAAGPWPTVMVLDFGKTVTRSGTDLVVRMPTADALNALVRVRVEE